MSSNKSKPKLLSVPQIAQIHIFHAPTGKAIQAIVDYVNKTVVPATGTRIAPRKPRNSQI
jgi:hypothetical protein